VLLVHFTNLKQNLPGEMRRIAAFLDIPLDESRWDDILEYCAFEWIKQNADKGLLLDDIFWDNGIHFKMSQGVNGRWIATLTSNDVMAYEACAVKELGPECTQWLATGEGWV
jgi:aryl sulfotransferase